LSDFDRDERDWVDALCRAAAENAALLADKNDAEFQNRVHRAMDGIAEQE
jgi:PTH1 family peptidyl-tRNA hydrolase